MKRVKIGSKNSICGIDLNSVKKRYHGVLFDNPLIHDELKTNDQFVLILFKIAETEFNSKPSSKVYYNPYIEKVTDYDTVLEHSKLIDWHCAECETKIQSDITDFSINNFLCDICLENYNDNLVSSKIVDSSYRFQVKCRNLLIKEQKHFLKYIKHFKSGYKKGIK